MERIKDDVYFFVDMFGVVVKRQWTNSDGDREKQRIGNVFSFYSDALLHREEMIKKLNKLPPLQNIKDEE